ncbi:MAG: rhodanese-like domain-containing protein [Gammaproteobacteria bacterium]|nr:rhodanese-like domain-containing protein [Gammaproteobacteria bacterium]
MRTTFLMSVLAIALTIAAPTQAADEPKVKITPDMASVEVIHDGQKTTISRNQDEKNTVKADFAKTSRDCPPFCIQPGTLAPGVETIGELEVLDYLKQIAAGNDKIMVIDSRTPDWVAKGTIPGSVNIPWDQLNAAKSDPFTIADILEKRLGARNQEGLWDFSGAKTLVLFCNGMWCGQSPTNIKTLLKYGYPADKIKWYRGGMQDWEILGMTTVIPKKP